jgi:hypothetical protein
VAKRPEQQEAQAVDPNQPLHGAAASKVRVSRQQSGGVRLRNSVMVEMVAEVEPLIRPLCRLASVSFEPSAFRAACESFASFDNTSSDSDLWYFRAARRLVLIVSVEAEPTGKRKSLGEMVYQLIGVRFAVLSFCWWETFLQSQHPSAESFQAERARFDQAYAEALVRTVGALGEPLLQGADPDEDGHRWAIWRGQTGLFVLQQSAYDPQFGLDINYWICPWYGPDPRPSSPFIDWLSHLG